MQLTVIMLNITEQFEESLDLIERKWLRKDAFRLAYKAIDKAEQYEKALKEIAEFDSHDSAARYLQNLAKQALS